MFIYWRVERNGEFIQNFASANLAYMYIKRTLRAECAKKEVFENLAYSYSENRNDFCGGGFKVKRMEEK